MTNTFEIEPVRSRRAPGIAHFALNGFRVLRLPVDVPAERVPRQAQRILARTRAGLEAPERDLLPWLPKPDDVDIQEAAHRLEEPLKRLVESFLWFGAEAESRPALEPELASCNVPMLVARLASVSAPDPLRLLAARIDRANVALLLAISTMHSTRVQAAIERSSLPPAQKPVSFRQADGLSLADDPHHALAVTPATDDPNSVDYRSLLEGGLSEWMGILGDQLFPQVVQARIAALDDELVTADDTESVVAGVRTAILDMIVAEARHAVMTGDVARVRAFVGAMTKVGADESSDWRVALKPLAQTVRAEIDELAPLLEGEAGTDPRNVRTYLRRVGEVTTRWEAIDPSGLIVQDAIVDDAVSNGLARLRQGYRPPAEVSPELEPALTQCLILARSVSLEERVKAFLTIIKQDRESLCFFCSKRFPTADSCAAMSSKVETSRERYFNQTTIHYRINGGIILRCPECAALHDFIRSNAILLGCGAGGAAVLATVALTPRDTAPWVLGTACAVVLAIAIWYFAERVLGRLLPAKDERPWYQYVESPDYHRFGGGGTFDMRADASRRLKMMGVAAYHSSHPPVLVLFIVCSLIAGGAAFFVMSG